VISLAGKVTAGLVESNGSLPMGLWLMSPTGWLPRNRDQLRMPNARNRVWDDFTLLTYFGTQVSTLSPSKYQLTLFPARRT